MPCNPHKSKSHISITQQGINIIFSCTKSNNALLQFIPHNMNMQLTNSF